MRLPEIAERKHAREMKRKQQRAIKTAERSKLRRNRRYRKFALRSTNTFQPTDISHWTKPTLRRYLFERQRGLCHYCHERMRLFSTCKEGKFCTIDHVVPKICGGQHDLRNVVGAVCFDCNSTKWNCDDVEFYVETLFRGLTRVA